MLPTPLHVLTFASGSYLRWLALLHANLRLLALPATDLSVCTGDETSRRAAGALGVEVLDFSNESAGTLPPRQVAERYGTASYVRVVHAKTHCIVSKLSRLAQHADARAEALLLFVDGDVTLFGDPRPHFAAMGVDLALMSDRQGGRFNSGGACGYPPRNASAAALTVFNSGFFLLRVGPAALWLWSTVQDYHRNHPQVMQQAALNTVLDNKSYLAKRTLAKRMRRTLDVGGMRLRLAAFDEAKFLNGHCFYERRPLRTDAANVMAVHHNFIDGDGRKFERARAYHAVVDESDKTWEAFTRRSRAAMDANASWGPWSRHWRSRNWRPPAGGCVPAFRKAGLCVPAFRTAVFPPSARQVCSGGHDAFEVKWSPLRRQCHKKRAPRPRPFCRARVPPALWAVNGAGADWLRVVLELATGYSTGSLTEDRALTALLPSEKWLSETTEECGSMLVVATRGNSLELHDPPWTQIACGGAVTRAIFLVRHPFAVAWASWKPPAMTPEPGLEWPDYAWNRARSWVYLVDHSLYRNSRVDSAYRVWMRERGAGAHVLVRLEDLLEGDRAEYELRRVLDFVLDGQHHLGSDGVRCALREATATLRAANRAKEEECVVVHGGAPNCCAQCAMRRAFEHTFNHGRGASARGRRTNRSVGDAVWEVAAGIAPKFGYTRQGYTALGPHMRPSFGAQSSVVQLLECDCSFLTGYS